MKTLNYIFKNIVLLGISFGISSCDGCRPSPPPSLLPIVETPRTPPPCAMYHRGTVIFENIGKHNLMLYMHYNTKQYIEAERSLPVTKIPSGSHQYRYKEMETRKQKGGIVTFEVCDCETTYVTLPSNRYYSCGTSP